VHPDHTLEVALERFSESPGLLPVVSRSDVARADGFITIDTITQFLRRHPE
jgi:hypothetical protein